VAKHRIFLKDAKVVPGVQALIELRLGVRTEVWADGIEWGVDFDAPENVSLDFLRPAILPPNEVEPTIAPGASLLESGRRIAERNQECTKP
jgi:hypothetical protein